ncbi:uncharacterized protein PgNI_08467 [Pyricularia grisea]|uniref:Heterokaryon incompatibility domain-containing protein n=1 Tax=Pyricularia grisea TaxID=148305 RepID=A0A6P8AX13_PYRGI|nr:uncharacterized protein PgNI_08467 [Pyricularia grisea]TLD06704.1 hypothetical protein PgNI_08467 [Pyricularia grisea]
MKPSTSCESSKFHALYIIQDSQVNSKWLEESTRMHHIYGGSYLNIAASSAKGANEGVFKKDDREETHIFYRATAVLAATVRTHLDTRARAFQERLLAPRTVHSGDCGIFFECGASLKLQDVPVGAPLYKEDDVITCTGSRAMGVV